MRVRLAGRPSTSSVDLRRAIDTHLQKRFVANCSELRDATTDCLAAFADVACTGCNCAIPPRDAPEVSRIIRPELRRAQGMPGARCTGGLVCKKAVIGAHEHTGQRRAS